MAELIKKTDTLNQGREKLNEAITDANRAKWDARTAKTKAEQALLKSESTQTQLNEIVIEGDSSVEAAQARVSSDGTAYGTLKERLDAEHTEVTTQLAQITLLLSNFPRLHDENDDSFRILRAIEVLKVNGGGTLFLDEPSLEIKNLTTIQSLTNFRIYARGCTLTVSGEVNHNYHLEFNNCTNGVIEGLSMVGDLTNLPSRPFRLYNSSDIEVCRCSVENTLDHGFTTMGSATENITYRNCKAKNIGWHTFAHASALASEDIPKGNIKYIRCICENAGYDHLNPNIRKNPGMAFDVHNNELPVWIKNCVMINCPLMGKNSSGQGGDIYWIENKFSQDSAIDYSGASPILQLGNPNGKMAYFLNNIVEVSVQAPLTLMINYGNATIRDNVFTSDNLTLPIALIQQKASDKLDVQDNEFNGFNVNGDADGTIIRVQEQVREILFNDNFVEKITVSTSGRTAINNYYNGSYQNVSKISFDKNTVKDIVGGETGNYYIVGVNSLDRLSIKENDFFKTTPLLIKPITGGASTKFEFRNNLNLDGDNVISE